MKTDDGVQSEETQHLQGITSTMNDKYVFWLMLVVPPGQFRSEFLADDAENLQLLCQIIESCQSWEVFDFLIDALDDLAEVPKLKDELYGTLAQTFFRRSGRQKNRLLRLMRNNKRL